MDMQTFAGAVPAGAVIEFEDGGVDEEASLGSGYNPKTRSVEGLYSYVLGQRKRGRGEVENLQQDSLERIAKSLESSSRDTARFFDIEDGRAVVQKKMNILGMVMVGVSTALSVGTTIYSLAQGN